jgi:hypothetical protein
MPVNEASEILALSLIFVVHVAGGLALVWGMLEGEARPGPWWRRRRGGGPGGPPGDPPPPAPAERAPLPLADADPSRVRLRDEAPLRDGYERPARRPQRAPDRSPSRR